MAFLGTFCNAQFSESERKKQPHQKDGIVIILHLVIP